MVQEPRSHTASHEFSIRETILIYPIFVLHTTNERNYFLAFMGLYLYKTPATCKFTGYENLYKQTKTQ